MLKLKFQYFGHWCRADSLEKTLILGKIEGRKEGDNRGGDDWTASLTQWTWVSAISGKWWRTEKPGMLSPWGYKELNATEWLNNSKIQFYQSLSFLFSCRVIVFQPPNQATELYLTLHNPTDCSTPGLPVLHYLCSFQKIMFAESVMPSNPLILCHPLSFCLQYFPVPRYFPMSWLFASQLA